MRRSLVSHLFSSRPHSACLALLVAACLVPACLTGCSVEGTEPPPDDDGASPPALTACVPGVSPVTGDVFAITGAAVLPMDRERVLDDQTVIWRNGRVERVGPAASTPVPDGATRIDGRGAVVMPALADMHSHAWHPNDLFLYLAYGVTTVRNMWGSDGRLAVRRMLETGERVGPRLVAPGPGVDGPPERWPGTAPATTPEEGRQVVRDQAAAGVDFVKVYTDLAPDVYAAVAEEAKAQGLAFAGHVPPRVGLAEILRAGQSSTEHLMGYPSLVVRGGGRSWEGTVDPGALDTWARRTADSDTWTCPTLTVINRTARDLDRLRAQPLLEAVTPSQRRTIGSGPTAPPDWDPAPAIANMKTVLHRLHAQGAPLLVGTDAGLRYVLPGPAVHEELRLWREAGLSRFAVLHAATAGAQAYLQATHPGPAPADAARAGTVAEGAATDLLVLDGNPLDDLSHAERPAGVLQAAAGRGRWLTRTDLDAAVAGLASCYRSE